MAKGHFFEESPGRADRQAGSDTPLGNREVDSRWLPAGDIAMTTAELLDRLDGVRARGVGRWMARCPAHDDRSPSLSIQEGDRGILLRCWAGCTLEEITKALGLAVRDLFFDALDADPRTRQVAAQRRDRERQHQEQRQHADGVVIDALKAAEQFIDSRRKIDISAWTDQRLDEELNALADAYAILEREGLYERTGTHR